MIEEAVKSQLNTRFWGQKLICLEETDSTNNEIKKMAEKGAKHGTTVIAEIQTAGRGRRGRSWSSPKESGIWMSFLLRPKIAPQNASMLTLVAALAVRDAIFQTTQLKTLIKWPNDIVAGGRKICGILTEMCAETDKIHYVVVGIGINANMEAFPEDIKDVATSLFLECKRKIQRESLVAAFGEAFEKYYEKFLQTEDLSLLMEEYNQYLANCNNKVKIIDTSKEYTGISGGINAQGELLVTNEEGELQVVRSGEVSVRGIYGYV